MSTKDIIQSEALIEVLKYRRSGVAITMRGGKTRLAIQHFVKKYHQFIEVLVVIPKLSVVQSWTDELIILGLDDLKKHIKFCTYLSLHKENPNDYDIVYLDECHSLLETHNEFLSNFKGEILGLTGTPPVRKGTTKYNMVQKYCPIVYTLTVDDATDRKIINNYQIVIHQLELSKLNTVKKKKKDGTFWFTSELKDYNYITQRLEDAISGFEKQKFSIIRMKSMMDYKTKEDYTKDMLKNTKGKCIVFANTQIQAEKMCKHSYHAKNPLSKDNLQLFKDGRINQLSCVLQLSEGVTIHNLKLSIIMHAYGNERKTPQRLGRILGLNPSETAICHILCYKNTVDEKWIAAALKGFNPSKVTYFNPLIN